MTNNDTIDETEIETTDTTLTLRRTFDASRERVWRAFTEPDELEEWYAPGNITSKTHTLELEPDGAFSFNFVDRDDRVR